LVSGGDRLRLWRLSDYDTHQKEIQRQKAQYQIEIDELKASYDLQLR
jgi:chromosome segregation ATPase